MTNKLEKGVSLIVAFLVMTIMLAIVLNVGLILFSEIKISGNIGNAVSSLYAAESGIEKTLYFDKKQIPVGATRGVCSICDTCNSSDCQNCVATPLATGGCDSLSCTNCNVQYNSDFGDRSYTVDAKITPYSPSPSISIFNIDSKGLYKDTLRVIEINTNQ